MAHTKAGGSTRNGRDSNSKRLGVKLFGGQTTNAGQIIIRQRGLKWEPGENVAKGKDDTLYSKVAGVIRYTQKRVVKFTGHRTRKTVVNVDPITE
ncbi:MAG: 50S ribosomal protein L27 [bacterium]